MVNFQENNCCTFVRVLHESPSQLYQDRIILITDMAGKGCLLCTENTKLLFF